MTLEELTLAARKKVETDLWYYLLKRLTEAEKEAGSSVKRQKAYLINDDYSRHVFIIGDELFRLMGVLCSVPGQYEKVRTWPDLFAAIQEVVRSSKKCSGKLQKVELGIALEDKGPWAPYIRFVAA